MEMLQIKKNTPTNKVYINLFIMINDNDSIGKG